MKRLISTLVVLTLLGAGADPSRPNGPQPSATAMPASTRDVSTVLVVVDGEDITEADLEFLMISRGIPADVRPMVRKEFLGRLVDQRLVRAFLKGRKAEASPLALDSQVEHILHAIEQAGQNPQDVLAVLGYDEKQLREELALPLAWQVHIHRIVTQDMLRDYFKKHQSDLDGTEVRASHIIIKVPTDRDSAELQAAEDSLRKIRKAIVSGTTTFANAAKEHSQSPSGENGGDIGLIRYRGRMPVQFSQVAFSLEPGKVSEPFRTRYGVHLCLVTERHEGDLSLEDVREQVLEQLSQEVWDDTVRDLRSQAQIEWKT